jgi:hypothetical protein
MSNNNFVKGECRHCAGHLEFAADAAGETIQCPHCGQPTELVLPVSAIKTGGSGRMRFGMAVAVFVVLVGLAAVFFLLKKNGSAANPADQTTSASQTNTSAPPAASLVIETKPPAGKLTNDFTISAFKLEKTPGSSLVYVTGKIQNLSDRQRFGVKVEFALFDTNNNAVGHATDYQPVIDPHGDWRFKALVMDSKAVSAELGSISEDQQ